MKNHLNKFLVAVLIVTLICIALQMVWNKQAPQQLRSQYGFVLLGVFSLFVTLVHLFLLRAAKGEPQSFVRKFMAASVLKFMFYILLLVLLLLFSSDNKTALAIHFLFYYAVFTVIEVGFLYSNLKKLK